MVWSLAYFLEIHSNNISHLGLGLPSGLFHLGFPTKILNVLISIMRAACPNHLILLDLIITHLQ